MFRIVYIETLQYVVQYEEKSYSYSSKTRRSQLVDIMMILVTLPPPWKKSR